MVQKHNVVIAKGDGGVELYPMKDWLREHPENIPAGLDGRNITSHQLRAGLCKNGWTMQQTETEVRLIPPNTASAIIDSVMGGEAEVVEEELPPSAAFALEFQLRDFIAQNIETIDVQGQKLKLFVDDTGREGIEYPTAVGPIDILAKSVTGAFYVFELKRARSPDRAIGQLMRYMGWVNQTIGKEHDVRGIIVAKEIKKNLRYAVSVVPNVSLFKYQVSFQLKPANDVPLAVR